MKKVLKNIFSKKNSWILIIVLLSVPASLPLLHSGFYHFSDEPHIANLQQMIQAFISGQLPPRWASDMSWGFGYPLFNFYYPLPYYIGSLFYLFNHSLVSSLKLVFLLTIPFSGITMYLWLKNHTSVLGALVGAVIYIYTPYRALDLYIRGAVGECLAFVFVPLVAFYVDKVISEKSHKFVAFLAITIGLFFVSHNLAPLIFIPWLFIYGLVIIVSQKNFFALPRLVLGFTLGFLISSYWTIPAFLEKGHLLTQTPFNYIDHFPFIKQLIYSPWRYGASLPGPNDDLSFQIGFVNIFIIVYIIYLLFRKKVEGSQRLILIYTFCTLFFVLFLMNIRSDFLWRIFPLSTYVQFPWRFLMVTTFITSAMTMVIKNRKLLIAFALLGIFFNVNYFRPSGYFYPNDEYYLNRMLPYYKYKNGGFTSSTEYNNYSEDYLLLPKWVKVRPSNAPTGFFTTSSSNLDIILAKKNSNINYYADLTGSGLLEFNKYYFPGWYADVNGKPVEFKILEPYGNIGIDIQGEFSSINIYWKETPLRLTTDVISVLSILIAAGLIFDIKKRYSS